MVGDRSEPTLSLAERNMRLRAHTDQETRDAAHRFVMDQFGGDYQRALWCLDECGKIESITGEGSKMFSVRSKSRIPAFLRRNK